MRTRKCLCIPVVAAMALVAFGGCSKPSVVGKWTGELKMPASKDKNDPAAAMGEAMAKAFMSNLTLDLRQDNTFTMQMMFPIDGNWKMDGDRVTLTPTKIMGMDASKASGGDKSKQEPMVFKIEGDKLVAEAKGKDGSLVFTRAKT